MTAIIMMVFCNAMQFAWNLPIFQRHQHIHQEMHFIKYSSWRLLKLLHVSALGAIL